MNYFLKKHKLVAWIVMLTFLFSMVMPTNLAGMNSKAEAATVQPPSGQIGERINASFFFQLSPTANPDANDVNEFSGEVGQGYANTQNATWSKKTTDWGITVYNTKDRIDTRVQLWPSQKKEDTPGRYVLAETNSQWNTAFNNYKAKVAEELGITDLKKSDVTAIVLTPYKISAGNRTGIHPVHVDCTVEFVTTRVHTAIYKLWDADGTGYVWQDGQTVKDGETTTLKNDLKNLPPTKTVNGKTYELKGWYTNEAQSGTPVTFPYTVTENVTFYAKYVEVPKYTVTYNANGGSGAPTDANSYEAGATVTVATTDPTRTDYNFLGWADSATATAATYGTSFTMPASNVTLYAVWQPEPVYTVTFHWTDENGQAQTSAVGNKKAGDTVTQPDAVPATKVVDGKTYELEGWYTDAAHTAANKVDLSSYTVTGDADLYANYVEQIIPTVAVPVYVTNGANKPDAVLEDLLGLKYQQEDGYYPVGVVQLPETLFNGNEKYINNEEDLAAVLSAINAIDKTVLQNKGYANSGNTVFANLDGVQLDEGYKSGQFKTALFDWNSGESESNIKQPKDADGKDVNYNYHLDLRFATTKVNYVFVDADNNNAILDGGLEQNGLIGRPAIVPAVEAVDEVMPEGYAQIGPFLAGQEGTAVYNWAAPLTEKGATIYIPVHKAKIATGNIIITKKVTENANPTVSHMRDTFHFKLTLNVIPRVLEKVKIVDVIPVAPKQDEPATDEPTAGGTEENPSDNEEQPEVQPEVQPTTPAEPSEGEKVVAPETMTPAIPIVPVTPADSDEDQSDAANLEEEQKTDVDVQQMNTSANVGEPFDMPTEEPKTEPSSESEPVVEETQTVVYREAYTADATVEVLIDGKVVELTPVEDNVYVYDGITIDGNGGQVGITINGTDCQVEYTIEEFFPEGTVAPNKITYNDATDPIKGKISFPGTTADEEEPADNAEEEIMPMIDGDALDAENDATVTEGEATGDVEGTFTVVNDYTTGGSGSGDGEGIIIDNGDDDDDNKDKDKDKDKTPEIIEDEDVPQGEPEEEATEDDDVIVVPGTEVMEDNPTPMAEAEEIDAVQSGDSAQTVAFALMLAAAGVGLVVTRRKFN